MKGRNQLQLNKATMIDVVQMWVNATFKNSEKIEVTDVNYDSTVGVFTTNLQERTAE